MDMTYLKIYPIGKQFTPKGSQSVPSKRHAGPSANPAILPDRASPFRQIHHNFKKQSQSVPSRLHAGPSANEMPDKFHV
jgi:hypothetical protein